MAKYVAGDQGMIADAMATITRQFGEADANGDGRLNLEEHLAYCRILNELEASKGKFCITDADLLIENYAVSNCVNSAEDGYTMADMFSVMGPITTRWAVLKAAAEA